MIQQSLKELFEIYVDTLERCTPAICEQTDEELLCNLFEEFSVQAWSFLHDDSLTVLRDAGLIDDGMVRDSRVIRERWLQLEKRGLRLEPLDLAVHWIREGSEWRELFRLCEALRQRVVARNSNSR